MDLTNQFLAVFENGRIEVSKIHFGDLELFEWAAAVHWSHRLWLELDEWSAQ